MGLIAHFFLARDGAPLNHEATQPRSHEGDEAVGEVERKDRMVWVMLGRFGGKSRPKKNAETPKSRKQKRRKQKRGFWRLDVGVLWAGRAVGNVEKPKHGK